MAKHSRWDCHEFWLIKNAAGHFLFRKIQCLAVALVAPNENTSCLSAEAGIRPCHRFRHCKILPFSVVQAFGDDAFFLHKVLRGVIGFQHILWRIKIPYRIFFRGFRDFSYFRCHTVHILRGRFICYNH